DLHVQRVIPGPHVVMRDEDRAVGGGQWDVTVGGLLVGCGTGEIAAAEGEAVIAAHARVARRREPLPQDPADAKAPLGGPRGPSVVVDEEDLRPAGRAARDQPVERLPAHQRGVPCDKPRRRRIARGKVEAVDRPLTAEFLVERVIVDIPSIKYAYAAEYRRLPLLVQSVRQAYTVLRRTCDVRARR